MNGGIFLKIILRNDKDDSQVVENNNDLFIHDDLWTSFFLYYIKKVKILSEL